MATLQADCISDSLILFSQPNTNYGSDNVIMLRWDTASNEEGRGLFKFVVS